MPERQTLAGRRVLLVEDDFFVARAVTEFLRQEGAAVVGPTGFLHDAVNLVAFSSDLDAALLDVNLHGEMSFPLADTLMDRGVPCILMTGYDHSMIPSPYARLPWLAKPIRFECIAQTLLAAMSESVRAKG